MPALDVAVVSNWVTPQHMRGKVAVMVDAMRSSTGTLAALHGGAKDVRMFATLDAVRAAGEQASRGDVILAGETNGQVPGDLDVGASPEDLNNPRCVGKTIYLHAPNGHSALHVCRGADTAYVAAMANVSVLSEALSDSRSDIMFICAGWNGTLAEEDCFVAGSIVDRLLENPQFSMTASAVFARELFVNNRMQVREVFAKGVSGQALINYGLVDDVGTCCELDLYPILAVVADNPLRVVRRS